MKKIKNKLNIIILLLITLIVLYLSLKDNFLEVITSLKEINIFWLIISIIFAMSYYYFKSLSLYNFVIKFNNKLTFKKILKMTLITQFFDGITPSSTGGQPYQIYALSKENIKVVDGTNIAIQNFIVYQIALITIGFIAVIINKYLNLFETLGPIKKLIMLGFAINVIVIIALFSLAFLKKFNKIIIKLLVKILSKLKIIKKPQEIIDNLNTTVENFHSGALILLKDKKTLLKNIFFNMMALLMQYTVPVVILYGMGNYHSLNLLNSLIASTYVMLIGSFVPIPGASGGLEYAFTQFYGVFITGAQLSIVMLLWRAFTYYLGVIIGAILLNTTKYKKEEIKCE